MVTPVARIRAFRPSDDKDVRFIAGKAAMEPLAVANVKGVLAFIGCRGTMLTLLVAQCARIPSPWLFGAACRAYSSNTCSGGLIQTMACSDTCSLSPDLRLWLFRSCSWSIGASSLTHTTVFV